MTWSVGSTYSSRVSCSRTSFIWANTGQGHLEVTWWGPCNIVGEGHLEVAWWSPQQNQLDSYTYNLGGLLLQCCMGPITSPPDGLVLQSEDSCPGETRSAAAHTALTS
ncbi:hypothetical protein V6N12_052942 [Hibiscus sabdariffa]|uniref:Uncharacterized protein n=1 Tax=Hibiscus sabdariffa TaxID=183260 RepID=A0ABR2C3Q2_9ROSI